MLAFLISWFLQLDLMVSARPLAPDHQNYSCLSALADSFKPGS